MQLANQKNLRAIWAATAAFVIFGIAGVLGAEEAPAKKDATLTMEGSTTVGPIADAYAEYLQKAHPGLKVTVKSTGSGIGVKALIEGRCDIATASRFMSADEFKEAVGKGILPVAHAIAMDGICLIVNPANSLAGLKMAQIKDIFLGKIKNWKEVGGPDLEIVLISRETSSGTYEAFHEMVMKKEAMDEKTQHLASNQEVHDRVASTKGAIGYVGLGFVDDKIKGLTVDGVTPSKETIVTGTYPIARPLFLFTNGYPALGSLIHEVCTLHLSEKGQKMIQTKGSVPMTDY